MVDDTSPPPCKRKMGNIQVVKCKYPDRDGHINSKSIMYYFRLNDSISMHINGRLEDLSLPQRRDSNSNLQRSYGTYAVLKTGPR